ncbi:metal-binding protein [Deinococcus sp. Marseille-Q6407]|uniref:metal-binding protein n=1 Tax=Deinococcus sp. Marseille-Q6407 TaxID=2969223 RepID=UPI0021BF508A|nr:metal-binding protein [Deinococcus sp. Marseille-Q6407]
MPNGQTHALINLSVLTVVASSYLSTPTIQGTLGLNALWACGGFLCGTLLVTPDLDLNSPTLARKAWGPLGFIWIPYARLSRHRGMSHSYILGPLIRAAYITPLLYGALMLSNLSFTTLNVAYALAGYYLSQWLHSAADRIPLHHDLACLTAQHK